MPIAKKQKASARFAAEETNEPTNEVIESHIAEAIALDAEIKAKTARLKELKEEFLELFAEGKAEKKIVTPQGVVTLKETNSYSIDPAVVGDLREAFKGDYSVFVTEKTAYSPTAAMRKKLSDADYKHSELIRGAVVITTRQSVEFEAAKPAKLKLTKK